MDKPLTIGTLGKRVGLPAKTIRFYEDIGLISQPKRADNGYRVYEEKAVEELTLIKNARDLGLPIPEIKKLMVGCENGDCEHAKEYVEKEIGDYVEKLDKNIEQMQTLRTRLKSLGKHIDTNEDCNGTSYPCNILKQLTDVSKGGGI